MEKKTYNLQLKSKTWDYLGKISKLLGQSRSQMIREAIEQLEETLRAAFGDEPGTGEKSLTDFYRTMLLETSKALGQVADMPGMQHKK